MPDRPNKEYTVYFEGKMTVEAQSEAEATNLGYDILNECETPLQFTIKGTDEGECVDCEGTGTVSCDETDGSGNIERGVGTQKCLCKVDDGPDRDDE